MVILWHATGVFSRRKPEQATYDSMVFKYIGANENPDHNSLNSFRKRFNQEIEGWFVEIWVVAEAMRPLKWGTVRLYGTPIKAHASQHKALRWDYAKPWEARFKRAIKTLMQLAEAAGHTRYPKTWRRPPNSNGGKTVWL